MTRQNDLRGSLQGYETAQILVMKYSMLGHFSLPLVTAVMHEAIVVNSISETNNVSSIISVLHVFAFY
jgi:hypothetical protein